MKKKFIKAVLLDSQKLFCESLIEGLKKYDIIILDYKTSINGFLESIRKFYPDIIIINYKVAQDKIFEIISKINYEFKFLSIVILSDKIKTNIIQEGIKYNIKAFLNKDLDLEALSKKLKKIFNGEIIKEDLAESLLNNISKDKKILKLTAREKEILKKIREGKSNKQISYELYISERTVKNHIANIFRKLDIADRTTAAVIAIEEGI